MEGDKEELIKLRTELATVVEVLGVLHDFVESVFGAKYQNFIISSSQLDGAGNDGNSNYGFNMQSALRKLRWKHSKCDMDVDRTIATPPSKGISEEIKGNNGYPLEGTPVTTLGVTNSVNSTVSRNNEMYNPTAESMSSPEGQGKKEPKSLSILSLSVGSVGRPEIVAVKCEVDDTDFLDDVDPFESEEGDFLYEDSDLKINNCYPLPSSSLAANKEDSQNHLQASRTFGDPHSSSSPRFIPELIPIQSDPLLQNSTPLSTVKEEDEESGTSFSDNSDIEWHPSSTFINVSSKNQKNDVNCKFLAKPKRSNQPVTFSNVSANNCAGIVPMPIRSQPAVSLPTGSVVGGLFKCDMCSASYKQEESLRSHQKYKHNPSRVQCTCHLCGKSMVDKYRLQRHLRLHTGEKPFECEYCGQSFYRKDYHTKHLQRKHGISYTTGPPSKIVRKPTGKPKASTLPSSSSTFMVSSSPTASSASFQTLRCGVFETPSPPSSFDRKPLMGTSLACRDRHGFTTVATTTSPSSLSTSPATTSSSTSTGEIVAKEYSNNFVDIFSNHSNKVMGWAGNFNTSGYCSNIGGISNLTFDDLVSDDF